MAVCDRHAVDTTRIGPTKTLTREEFFVLAILGVAVLPEETLEEVFGFLPSAYDGHPILEDEAREALDWLRNHRQAALRPSEETKEILFSLTSSPGYVEARATWRDPPYHAIEDSERVGFWHGIPSVEQLCEVLRRVLKTAIVMRVMES